MKKKILAICDGEELYLERIRDYLNHHGMPSFMIMTFSSIEKLQQYMQVQKVAVEIVLLAEALYDKEVLEQLEIGKLIVLQEEGYLIEENVVMLHKYQSIITLMQEVMEAYVEDEACEGVLSANHVKTKLIGFYTPGGGDAAHLAALTFSQLLAQREKVLYLHLGTYPILKELFAVREEEFDLSDLVYFLKQKEEKVLYKLEGMRRRVGEVDYILPIPYPEDLQHITEQEWSRLFECICFGGEYAYIIVDYGEGIQGLHNLLQQCDYVVSTYQENSFDEQRMSIFTRMCREKGKEDILEKLRQVLIPNLAMYCHIHPENLTKSILGKALEEVAGFYAKESI